MDLDYLSCPSCQSTRIKLNGHIHNGKQNHRCLVCGRQFVENPQQILVSESDKDMVKALLLERISLRGICRCVLVSLKWLLKFISKTYKEVPDDLNVIIDMESIETYTDGKLDQKIYNLLEKDEKSGMEYEFLSEEQDLPVDNLEEHTNLELSLEQGQANVPNDSFSHHILNDKNSILFFMPPCEADEAWSFVDNKGNKQWIWLAMNVINRQIIGLYIGDRSQKSAMKLWENIPNFFKENFMFFTDFYKPYQNVIPEEIHSPINKAFKSRFTNHIERFNNTLRQRCSRLVRQTLSFSKKLDNHIGAIKYFIAEYNMKIALHG